MAVYACADLHGCYNLFKQIQNFIQPEDTVYVLGDCADRHPDGWQIIKEVFFDHRFIYLFGNHEDMLIDAIQGVDYKNCFQNGGEITYFDWTQDGEDPYWADRLLRLPKIVTYMNKDRKSIFLCHAGFSRMEKSYYPDVIWDRTHIADPWTREMGEKIIIHGHTPIPDMNDFISTPIYIPKTPFWYCFDDRGKPHKCDIDCGSFETGYTLLLNLDTFEYIVFEEKERINND